MNSQAISLLGWLRMKFGDIDIRILLWSEELMAISLFKEGQFVDFGYPEEAMAAVARSDKHYYDFETCDFLVILPAGSDVDREAVRIEIDKFIPIDVKYKVIQQEDLVPPQDELPTTVGIYFYALALQDYLRISTASDGIAAIPPDDYLTPISLFTEGIFLSVGTGNEPLAAIPAAGEVYWKFAGKNIGISLPEGTDVITIRSLADEYALLNTRYFIVNKDIPVFDRSIPIYKYWKII
ncbi:hypothetical protein Barb6_00762 [Bacteroidales bacterium Barb6]|nr:hypothetical protein Barb6_00762 [Bacteroidales bacterium Barb6]